MRTQGYFLADTAHQGGWLIYNASQVNVTGANFAFTKNAVGDYSYNLAASQSGVVVVGLADLKRLIEVSTAPLPFQEQFGVAAGTAGYPAGAPGLPPFTGATQLTPPTGQPAKGVKINNIVVVYLITGAAATTNAFSLSRTTFANNVALSIASPAVTGALATATQANPYVTTITVTTPAFENTDLADLNAEVNVATAVGGAYRFYAIGFHVDFNFD